MKHVKTNFGSVLNLLRNNIPNNLSPSLFTFEIQTRIVLFDFLWKCLASCLKWVLTFLKFVFQQLSSYPACASIVYFWDFYSVYVICKDSSYSLLLYLIFHNFIQYLWLVMRIFWFYHLSVALIVIYNNIIQVSHIHYWNFYSIKDESKVTIQNLHPNALTKITS